MNDTQSVQTRSQVRKRKMNFKTEDKTPLLNDEIEELSSISINSDKVITTQPSKPPDISVASKQTEPENESTMQIIKQVAFPFHMAAIGLVCAGLVLDKFQHWLVFERISELYRMDFLESNLD